MKIRQALFYLRPVVSYPPLTRSYLEARHFVDHFGSIPVTEAALCKSGASDAPRLLKFEAEVGLGELLRACGR